MRSFLLAVAMAGIVVAGCSKDPGRGTHSLVDAKSGQASPARSPTPRVVAGFPDGGTLFRYDRRQAPLQRGDALLYPVQISERHAFQAISNGGMVLEAPDGHPIHLRYLRHVEQGNGIWTWIGRTSGEHASGDAILTFGERAVFGTLPDGRGGTLELTTLAGRTWLVASDPHRATSGPGDGGASGSDVLLPNTPGPRPGAAAMQPLAAAASLASAEAGAVSQAPTVVDLVLGYTTGFATRLGGVPQAQARLSYLVELTNQAYIASQVNARLRIVGMVQVGYADATTNQGALFQLSGLSCTPSNVVKPRAGDSGMNCVPASVPAALQPLVAARERHRADLVTLVRTFQYPENGSCGVAWLIGAGQTAVSAADAQYGTSVVSDSGGRAFPDSNQTCREEYLAHELGHNMGLQHDRGNAAGVDDTNADGNPLDPEEFGRFADAFGQSADEAHGNFYTIMSLPRAGQDGYRVFSNPRITSCSGLPCGVTGEADNARVLSLTIPVVAAFRNALATVDFNDDARSDVLWRHDRLGANAIWKSADRNSGMAVAAMGNLHWKVAGTGDFDGDRKADILWRNDFTGDNLLWFNGRSTSQQLLVPVTDLAWKVVGVGDFDDDGKADILWRHDRLGANSIWRSGNRATGQAVSTLADLQWKVAGVGDFDGDGKSDILWRHGTTGNNVIWRSARAATQQAVVAVTDVAWKVVGIGDFNADGKSDVLWRHERLGANSIWLSADRGMSQAVSTLADLRWKVAKVGDFDGDARADIFWRHAGTGNNVIWKSGRSGTQQPVDAVADLAWKVAG